MTSWLRRNFEQEAFRDDWYGWLTNQLGHIVLGLTIAYVAAMAWFGLAGEMPYKIIAWPVCLGLYVWLEWVRGWAGWDSVEDTIFTSIYGSGGGYLLFTEVQPGSATLEFHSWSLFPAMGVILVHIVYGVSKRWPR